MRIFNLENIFYSLMVTLTLSLFTIINEIDTTIHDDIEFRALIITSQQWDVINQNLYDNTTNIDSTESCSPPAIDSTELYNEGLGGEMPDGLQDVRVNNSAFTVDY